jgi:hypothetical protein
LVCRSLLTADAMCCIYCFVTLGVPVASEKMLRAIVLT